MSIATCIGCGCTDDRACEGGCRWMVVDRVEGVGVCSNCPEHQLRYIDGDRQLSTDAKLRVEHLKRIRGCSSCSAPLVFLPTARGSVMPVNADSVSPADTTFDSKKHVSHFAHCPNASKHRRPR